MNKYSNLIERKEKSLRKNEILQESKEIFLENEIKMGCFSLDVDFWKIFNALHKEVIQEIKIIQNEIDDFERQVIIYSSRED